MNTKLLLLTIVAIMSMSMQSLVAQPDAVNGEKLVALTFDDGPNTVTTPQVLDRLEKYGVKATFFLIGNNINEQSAEVVKRARRLGCDIANHSLTHSHMTQLTADRIAEEVKITSDKIESITGKPTAFFRPPYIDLNQTMYDAVDMTFICGIMGNDWMDNVSPQQRYRMVADKVTDGTIILLHDMEGNSKTVEALDLLIPDLLKQGYKFVTVSELFDMKGITPKKNVIYSNVFQQQ